MNFPWRREPPERERGRTGPPLCSDASVAVAATPFKTNCVIDIPLPRFSPEHHGYGAETANRGVLLVEDAVDYANQWGLVPHADYRAARRVFGGIDARQCDRTFTFGKDGKPFYIQGPHESPARVQTIMRQLEDRCGVGHYDSFVLTDSAGAEWQPE